MIESLDETFLVDMNIPAHYNNRRQTERYRLVVTGTMLHALSKRVTVSQIKVVQVCLEAASVYLLHVASVGVVKYS
jgi:hypothetical protein